MESMEVSFKGSKSPGRRYKVISIRTIDKGNNEQITVFEILMDRGTTMLVDSEKCVIAHVNS